MSAVLVEKFGLSEVYKMELKKREIIKQFLTTAIERTLREVLPEGCIEGKDEDASSIDSDFIEGKQLGFNECRDQMITNSKKGGYGVTN